MLQVSTNAKWKMDTKLIMENGKWKMQENSSTVSSPLMKETFQNFQLKNESINHSPFTIKNLYLKNFAWTALEGEK